MVLEPSIHGDLVRVKIGMYVHNSHKACASTLILLSFLNIMLPIQYNYVCMIIIRYPKDKKQD